MGRIIKTIEKLGRIETIIYSRIYRTKQFKTLVQYYCRKTKNNKQVIYVADSLGHTNFANYFKKHL